MGYHTLKAKRFLQLLFGTAQLSIGILITYNPINVKVNRVSLLNRRERSESEEHDEGV